MPAYNFKPKFVVPILKGEKCTTIRRRRKRPTRIGETLSLYTGMRTKACTKFASVICIAVRPVVIWPEKHLIGRNAHRIFSIQLTEIVARRDGFASPQAFFGFFRKQYGPGLLEGFEIIEWDPENLKIGWQWAKEGESREI